MKAVFRFRTLLGLVVLAGLGLWLIYGPLAGWVTRKVLVAALDAQGWEAEAGEVRARPGTPTVIRNLWIHAADAPASQSEFFCEEVRWEWNWGLSMFGQKGRLIKSLSLRGARVVVDLHRAARPPEAPQLRRPDEETRQREARTLLRWLPRRVVIEGLTADLLWQGGGFSVRDIVADFDEAARGRFQASGMEIRFGNARQVFAGQRAVTAWKNGSAYFADMAVRVGMSLEKLSLDLARPGGMAVDVQAALFGGTLRGSVSVGDWRGEPGVDATLGASGLKFVDLSEFLGLHGRASGTLSEGRISFRGNPDRPLDGEASLWISAENFRLGERGWKTLEASASLINRRLSLSDLKLRQEENQVSANGEMALSGGLGDVTNAPFLLNLSAKIQDMTSLGALLGSPFKELKGRMTASAALSGRSSKIEGFLGIEASGMALRGSKIESARLDAVFTGSEAQVQRLEIWSSGDAMSGQGTFALAAPHTYSGQVTARARDLAVYSKLLEGVLPFHFPVTHGGMTLHWQGDGNWNAHSGAFQATLKRAVSSWTPRGVTGRFDGTYSPKNFYFSRVELEGDRSSLTAQATIAESGLHVKGLTMSVSGKPAATGELFLPVNVFQWLQQKQLSDAIVREKPVYLLLETLGELPMKSLLDVFGQTPWLDGRLRGAVRTLGTTAEPEIGGRLTIEDGRLDLGHPLPEFSDMQGALHFDGRTVRLEAFRGEMGGGAFSMTGSWNFTTPVTPRLEMSFKGSSLLLFRDPGLKIRGNVLLGASGQGAIGALRGSVQLVDGNISKRLEVTPLLALPASSQPAHPFAAPTLDGKVPTPWSAWSLDVSINNASSILWKGDVKEIVPNIHLTGTLGKPRLTGTVRWSGARAFLPLTTLTMPEGLISFSEALPWMPVLDVSGTAQVKNHDIQLHTTGPLSEAPLILRSSDPSLSQTALLSLLTTGSLPVDRPNAGVGDAVIFPDGTLTLPMLLRQFPWKVVRGFGTDTLVIGRKASAASPPIPGSAVDSRTSLRQPPGISPMAGSKGPGDGSSLTYQFRFR